MEISISRSWSFLYVDQTEYESLWSADDGKSRWYDSRRSSKVAGCCTRKGGRGAAQISAKLWRAAEEITNIEYAPEANTKGED